MRRTKLLLTVLSLLFPLMMNAQGLDLGLKLGVNMAKVNSDATWDDGYKTGLLGGAFGGVNFGKFGVRVEALFSQQKYTTSDGSLWHSAGASAGAIYNDAKDSLKDGTFRAAYLNIPVLLNFKVYKGLHLLAGPQYSGLVSVKDEDNLLKDAGALFKSGEFSGVIGAELKLILGLHVGARYIIGFSDMNNTNFSETWKNSTIQLNVGWSIL